jgi:eukaryotic-like serine/threonine-protein kinase
MTLLAHMTNIEHGHDEPIIEFEGAYRLVRKIADGGMAAVYEADMLGPAGFTKRVALKVIHPRYARHRDWVQAFIDEAKLVANLVHGNIVQIYQLGKANGQFYIAMEYIQGPTLRAVIDAHRDLNEPIPLGLAAYLTSRVCRALDFAHNFVGPHGRRLDIVHRDVSPGNVMATWDGHIKLADFGIAKANTSIDIAAAQSILVGKKHYMSPEQSLGLSVDARSDVFSVGVMMFELMTLDRLFKEELTELAIDEISLKPLPSLRSLLPNAPPEIEHVLTSALDREPSRRPTAAAMGVALDRWCARQSDFATPDRLQEHLHKLFPEHFAPRTEPMPSDYASLTGARKQLGRKFLARLLGR